MSSAIISIINHCYETKESVLDLGRCGLKDADFKTDSEISLALGRCTHLQTLILSNEWWTWGGREKWWVNHASNNKGARNFFSEIPPVITKLKNLKRLICCGEMNDAWGIVDLSILERLQQLTYLDIRDNQIRDLTPIQDCTLLEILFANRNKITHLRALRSLHRLSHIDIHTNKIQSLEGLSQLKALQNLDIHNNRIHSIAEIAHLDSLQEIYIGQNKLDKLEEFSFVLNKSEPIYINISKNPVVLKHSLLLHRDENHFPFLVELLSRYKDPTAKDMVTYPVKVLLLGNHGSGKSSLVDFLVEKNHDGSTQMLRIENYFNKNNALPFGLPNAILYDFGGQDFYHGLYKIFFSERTLQLILFSSTNDQNKISVDSAGNPTANFDRKYWLGQKRYVEILENQQSSEDTISAPYFTIQTFADLGMEESLPVGVVHNDGFKKAFFLSFHPNGESTAEQDVFTLGKRYFKAYFDQLLHGLQKEHSQPVWYIRFLQHLFELKSKEQLCVDIAELLAHYHMEGASKDDRLTSLVTNLILLHRHGVILFYPNIPSIRTKVWLNPQKLVEFIQLKILNGSNNMMLSPGIIQKDVFESAINDEHVLILLQRQKVVFLHRPTARAGDAEYIIPNHLPLADKSSEDYYFFTFSQGPPAFILKFDAFIPFGLINQAICFFGKQPDVKKFWRNQLLFSLNKEASVFLEIEYESLQINVHLHLLSASLQKKKLIQTYLFSSILALYWGVPDDELFSFEEFQLDRDKLATDNILKYKEKLVWWDRLTNDPAFVPQDVFVSIRNDRFVRYLDLFDWDGHSSHVNSYGLLHGAINSQAIQQLPIKTFDSFIFRKPVFMKKLFISYSKFDEAYKEEFRKHLVTLKDQGFVETFNCKQIDLGEDWDAAIQREIEECDIMICLVSVDFLNTNYIRKYEVATAIQQNKKLVPIIIKPCDWEDSEVGKFFASLRGQTVSLDKEFFLKDEVREVTAVERAAIWTKIVKELREKLFS